MCALKKVRTFELLCVRSQGYYSGVTTPTSQVLWVLWYDRPRFCIARTLRSRRASPRLTAAEKRSGTVSVVFGMTATWNSHQKLLILLFLNRSNSLLIVRLGSSAWTPQAFWGLWTALDLQLDSPTFPTLFCRSAPKALVLGTSSYPKALALGQGESFIVRRQNNVGNVGESSWRPQKA